MEKIGEEIYSAVDRQMALLDIEEYILSVCLHNEIALARCMNQLDSYRDFKDERNGKAYAVIEGRYHAGQKVDPMVISQLWVDMGIFERGDARYIFNKWDKDADFEPKIKELKSAGVSRKARKDLEKLRELTGKDVEPEKLIGEGLEMVMSWNSGASKKYLTAQELEQREKDTTIGDKLYSGIPLLDETLYEFSGQHKGTVKATIFREKHGKTRHACWEIAQDMRQGWKVMYVTLESTNSKIKNNIKQVLQHEWPEHNKNIFFADTSNDIEDVKSAIIEAVFAENVDKVVIDYLQRLDAPRAKYLSENENYNRCCKELTDLCVRYDFNLHIIAQPKSEQKADRGWRNVPEVYDVYGSKQLVKDASMILVGFRPKWYEELHASNPLGQYVKDPDGEQAPFNSVFLKPVLSREKLDIAHRWVHFVDTDEGYKLHRNELL